MIELARELGLALANSAEFIRMKNAQNAVEQNEGINAALTELREKRERLVNILAEEETDNLEALRLTNDIDRLEGQLQDNPLFLELLEAQAAFSTVLRTINDLTLATEDQTTPVKHAPGSVSVPFTFIVGPPAP